MQIIVTGHCVERYRRRVADVSDAEARKQVRRLVVVGKRATPKETAELLAVPEKPKFWRKRRIKGERPKRKPVVGRWFVLSDGLVFVVQRADGGGEGWVVITCWRRGDEAAAA